MDLLSFVPNVDVRLVEVLVQTSDGGLGGKMVAMHGAEEESAHLAGAAKFEEVAGMRQLADRILHLAKPAMEPGLQLRQWNVRDVAFVENRKRETKLSAKLLQAHLRPFGLRQDVVGRLPHRRQIIHQSARPIE